MLHTTYGSLGSLLLTKKLDWAADTVKLALLSNGYGPNFDTDIGFANCSVYEITGTGYSSGGATLTGKALEYDPVANSTLLKADDVDWPSATITCRYGVLYATSSGQPLLSLVDFQTDVSIPSGTFSVQWPNGVVLTLETA